ncbi:MULTISPECIES: AzlC family ABC transporter permease [Gordonibacter]|uniref:AzlC family ABC transporter permease n=1 Tax=Gordonibacter faecis TaxID=3047475 RepID=A0ABT7DM25_9ACTN|nr:MULTISPECIES: AzlC family ABC transporter permease [unclassified Gordonibacter]MDJ1649220.1 AzlC family ABC transporter permease [Gordonibacter sp. KGMB12511]HIW76623.1 AzlC family ABC transporter permease [Candidatus Gordonibacter avicola]
MEETSAAPVKVTDPGREAQLGTGRRARAFAALPFAFKQTLPLMAGFAFCGLSYGVYTTSLGLPPWAAPLMAVSIFAGSAEFVAADMLTATFAPLTLFLVVFMINARHMFYGISMLEKYRGAGRKTAFLRYGLIDETFALCQPLEVPHGIDRFWVYTWISALNLVYWAGFAAVGSYVASGLPIDLTGIDFIMKALFIVIFLDCWMKEHDHRASLIGFGAALVSLLVFGTDGFLVPALLGIVALLLLLRRQLEPRAEVDA